MSTYSYTLKILEGTSVYVQKELSEKYPDIKIVKADKDKILFDCEIEDINSFRNLYSPTHISNSKGNTLNLSKREWRVGFVPAGINPSLAYILCMIVNFEKENILLDPFCGSSVIPITALKHFNIKRVICTDISSKAIYASIINFISANIDQNRYKIFRNDILNSKISKRNVDRIVSNLPFGIRVGDHESNREAYKALEQLAQKVLRKRGILVLLTQEKVLIRDVFSKDIWDVKSIVRVNEGGLLPEVFLIKLK